jgi:predicted MFS family arabinose efflux permease
MRDTYFPFWRRHTTFLRWTLLGVALFDELVSGFLPVGLPLLQADLQLSYQQVGLLFTAGSVAAMLLEPGINVLSDRGSKRPWVLGGMLLLAIGFALAAAAPSFVWLLLAFTVTPPAGGAAVGLSQAVLIDAAPDAAPRTMTRWTLLGAIGDLLAPLTVALVAALSLGWRPLFWLAALVWLLAAGAAWTQHFPRPVAAADDDGEPGLLAGLRAALTTPTLLRWTAIVMFTSMLDEVFLGFAGLYLQDALHVNASLISLALGAQTAGAIIALVVLDRWVPRWRAERLLATLALVTLGGVMTLLVTRVIAVAAAALFVIGFGAAGWYPLAKAQAYAMLPGRSGTVLALAALGAPFEALLPVTVGVVAERWGIGVGIGVLGLAPLLVLACIPWRRSTPRAQLDTVNHP